MYDMLYDDHDQAETLRQCLRSAYDRQSPALMPRRMAELVEAIERQGRDGGSAG